MFRGAPKWKPVFLPILILSLLIAIVFSVHRSNVEKAKKESFAQALAYIETRDYAKAQELLFQLGDFDLAKSYYEKIVAKPVSSTTYYESDNFSSSTSYVYNSDGILTHTTYFHPGGAKTKSSYHYDNDGLLKEKIAERINYKGNGSKTYYEYSYDEYGRCILETGGGSKTTYIYGDNDVCIKEVELYKGTESITEYTYDEFGNWTLSTTSENGQVARRYLRKLEYNEFGQMIKDTINSNVVTTYIYDAGGNCIEEQTSYIDDNTSYKTVHTYKLFYYP